VTTNDSPAFDPVLLDLADPKDYVLLVSALAYFAKHLEGNADAEPDLIRQEPAYADLRPEDRWRADADRVRDIRNRATVHANSTIRVSLGRAA
jgi:hypothetical protein